jgi:hypothetical protein
MINIRAYCLTAAVLLSFCLVTRAQVAPLTADSSEPTTQTVPTVIANTDVAATTTAEPSTWALMANPFEQFGEFIQRTAGENSGAPLGRPADSAAPGAYPAAGSDPSTWAPTHFEILGFAQWRNISSNSAFSSSYCLPSGCVTNTGSFGNNLGLSGFGAGPLFRFIWTPEKKILGATSKIWVDWGQLNRSRTRPISGEFVFDGVDYVVNTTLKVELKTRQFALGYAPRWGNDKFRIGPEIEYQRLSVNMILTNLSPGAPPPIKRELNVPNNIVLLGIDFDYMPVQQFDVFGRTGWIPCCGGGWHENETEVGAKYYIRRSFSIVGGFRYYYLKRDFNAPATTITTSAGSVTLGPFSGFIKFPGIGPFVGASFRF